MSKDFGKRETKKPKKDNKQRIGTSIVGSAPVEVEVIKTKGKRDKGESED